MLLPTTRKERRMYLDWVNNYLGLDTFCHDYNITREEAETLIKNERNHPDNNPKT